MNKQELASIFFVVVIFITACGKKTIATKDIAGVTTPETMPTNPGKSTVELALADASLATGKTIYETKCTRCHGLKAPASYTEPRWDGILKIMVPKANLTQAEAQQVTAYLRANAKK